MKKSILLLALAFGFFNSYAQLTTRENENSVEKLGGRPVKGDMSFTFGLPLTKSNDSTASAHLYNMNMLKTGEILTFKCYGDNNVAYRFGFRIYSNNSHSKGTGLDSAATVQAGGQYTGLKSAKNVSTDRKIELVPGIEKHFSPANFFDAYLGADLYLGIGGKKTINETDMNNGDHNHMTSKTGEKTIGLGGVAGFNIFIAHLPISLGLEWGWNAKWTFNGKTTNKYDTQAGTVTASGTYVTLDKDPNAGQYYSKAGHHTFNADTNSDVRIVANIYFGK